MMRGLFQLFLLMLVLVLIAPTQAAATEPSGDGFFQWKLCQQPTPPSYSVFAGEPDMRYRTRFGAQNWSGELRKEQRSASGETLELWRASEQVPANRQIKIADDDASGLRDFRWEALSEQQQAVLNSDINGVFDGFGAARASLLRAEPCSDLEGCSLLRQQLPALGDSINAKPLLIAAPERVSETMERYDGPAGSYAAFKAKRRRAQVYLGANDGMLHAFDAQTGEERLAIIPSLLLSKLPALTSPNYSGEDVDQHRYFVDGPLVAQDVYYDQAWHTVLLVALGAGGQALLALDVTDPDNIQLLWEFGGAEHDLGYVLSAPTIARLHTGQWAALLGNGTQPPSHTAALLILDIKTGAVIRRLQANEAASGLAMPLVADTNGDGNADYAYAGDDQGNLWRFDLYDHTRGDLDKPPADAPISAELFRLSFAGRPLFSAPLRPHNKLPQPITTAPAIVNHPSEIGYLIVIGTGQNHVEADTDQQSLYAIWDRFTQGQNALTAGTVPFAALQQEHLLPSKQPQPTGRQAIDWYAMQRNPNGQLGWYFDLAPASELGASERVQEQPSKLGELLFITTRIPSLEPCQGDIERRLYAIDPTTGTVPLFPVFDLNADKRVDDQDGNADLPPFALSETDEVLIVADPVSAMPCLFGEAECAPLSLGPRANGRQSWRVVTDATP